MSFTYDLATEPLLSRVRLLVADTNSAKPIFQDDEINAAIQMESSQGLYISGQASQGALNLQIPYVPQIYSLKRSAALLLDSIAANYSRLTQVIELLDVKVTAGQQAKDLRAQAKQYRDDEANSGSFAIAEMIPNDFAARERIWKVAQRVNG